MNIFSQLLHKIKSAYEYMKIRTYIHANLNMTICAYVCVCVCTNMHEYPNPIYI